MIPDRSDSQTSSRAPDVRLSPSRSVRPSLRPDEPRRPPHVRLRRLALLLALLGGSAPALVVPLRGWTPIAGDASRWQGGGGECLIREMRHTQAFPALPTQQSATAMANRLRDSLGKAGLGEVTTQPVDRDTTWAVLAGYVYEEGGARYRVSQLYLSDGGKLRTISGSSAVGTDSPCAASMREFIRYQAE